MTIATLPSGVQVKFVPREQLRRKEHGRTLRIPYHLSAINAPLAPSLFDGSRGRKTIYPVLGNDRYGDCYLADALHCIQTWTAYAGNEASFDIKQVLQVYLQLSGGDNGLNDDQIFLAWKKGLFGHKILDDLTIDPKDDSAIQLGISEFCGGSYTAALPDAWVRTAGPGAVWDSNIPNQNNGHAMHLSGYITRGQLLPFNIPNYTTGSPAPFDFYCDETWGFGTPILLTPAGLKSASPEVTVQFSLDMFNAQGMAVHDGKSYDQKAALWQQLGGQKLPPNPFVNPSPVPPSPTPFLVLDFPAIRPHKICSFKAPDTGIPAGRYGLYSEAHKAVTIVVQD